MYGCYQSSRAGSIAGQRRGEIKEGTWQALPLAEVTAKSSANAVRMSGRQD